MEAASPTRSHIVHDRAASAATALSSGAVAAFQLCTRARGDTYACGPGPRPDLAMRQWRAATTRGTKAKSSAARTADASPRSPDAEWPSAARSAMQRERTSGRGLVGMHASNSANW